MLVFGGVLALSFWNKSRRQTFEWKLDSTETNVFFIFLREVDSPNCTKCWDETVCVCRCVLGFHNHGSHQFWSNGFKPTDHFVSCLACQSLRYTSWCLNQPNWKRKIFKLDHFPRDPGWKLNTFWNHQGMYNFGPSKVGGFNIYVSRCWSWSLFDLEFFVKSLDPKKKFQSIRNSFLKKKKKTQSCLVGGFQPIWKILVKFRIISPNSGEKNKKSLKPPPSCVLFLPPNLQETTKLLRFLNVWQKVGTHHGPR